MRIRWHQAALRDLVALRSYIRRYNAAAAGEVARRIREAAERLSAQPNLGRPGRVAGTRELVVPHTPCLIPYRVSKDTVEILRVYHATQRWPESFEE